MSLAEVLRLPAYPGRGAPEGERERRREGGEPGDNGLDAFTRETQLLVEAVIQSTLRGRVTVPEALDRRLGPVVRRAFEIGRENRETFEVLCGILDLDSASVYMSVQSILENMFSDDVNVGRLVTLLAFGGHLAEHCQRTRRGEMVRSVAAWIPRFLDARLRNWIVGRGGWVSWCIDSTFRDMRKLLLGCLVWFAVLPRGGPVGCMHAAAALLYRKQRLAHSL